MQVLNNLNNVNFDESDDESNLKTVCKNLVRSATSAYKTCFPEGSAHTSFYKTWWTQELSELKQIHFKIWKEHDFPRNEQNIYHNRYFVARKNFRKAVKKSQNTKIYDNFNKINSLKKTQPKKFWNKIRQMKENTKRQYTINDKQNNKDIVNEFADNFNSLLNNPVIERDSEPHIIPTETSL